MNIRLPASVFACLCTLSLSACQQQQEQDQPVQASAQRPIAPGAPGATPTWAYSGKTGIGTSYEQYVEGHYSDDAATGAVSKVWFSVAEGVVTETMYGLIHEAQIKDMQFVIEGPDFVDTEARDTNSRIEYLHTDAAGRPLSLAYKITNTDREGRYTIEKHLVTDPDQQTLLQRVIFTAHGKDITPHLVVNPHMANTGIRDSAWIDGQTAYSREGGTSLALISNASVAGSVGFVGRSDLLADLADGTQDWQFQTTGEQTGNVSLTLSLPTLSNESAQWDFALGFGESPEAARAEAATSLNRGFAEVLAHYNGEGEHLGWEDYLASLEALPDLAETAADGGALSYTSALVLKAQEDKTHAGALIASLSNPWGDIVPATESSTGYKAVWPRDFYQVAMAFLAMGDSETPLVAFRYLQKVQVGEQTPGFSGTPGWFLQKTHVDGTLEWYSVQLDQTAMPIMLGWQLWQQGVLSDDEIRQWYQNMLRPAADFLADGGAFELGWNNTEIHPPYTQQERWEEQEGHSPSTTAAVIAGLITAAEIAEHSQDSDSAQHYRAKADEYRAQLESRTFTTQGVFPGDGRYYLRVNRNDNPNDQGRLIERNGQGALNESEIVDPGFLELVRYGVQSAAADSVRASLAEVDNIDVPDYLRVKYEFTRGGQTFAGWRRYGGDGYGERTGDGSGYGKGGTMHGDQRGRVWPFLTGERGHYELARANTEGTLDRALLIARYVAAMEYFANEGLMLPEQVWDGVGSNQTYGYAPGEGTNSATPLAWTHAEYIKLLRSVHDGAVWDYYPPVGERYRD